MFKIKVPRFWRYREFRYRLSAWKCIHCGEVHFFKPVVCRRCRYREFSDVVLPHTGKLLAYTIVRSPPAGFEEHAPYIIGLIELDDGTKIVSQLADVDPEELRIGMKMEATFKRIREDGVDKIIAYGYKFRPAVQ